MEWEMSQHQYHFVRTFCITTAIMLCQPSISHGTEGMIVESKQELAEQLTPEEISKRADIFIVALKRDNPEIDIDSTESFKKRILKGKLILEDEDFSGDLKILPPEIGDLINLTHLNLSQNQFTTLPNEIGKLVNLTYLDVSENRLTTLPNEIGKLVNLTSLSILINDFITIPNDFWNLANLKELWLGGNQLITLSKDIGNLMNLERLDVSGNRLITLPNEIGNLVNLQELYLNDNQLITLPNNIGKLVNARHFDLEQNQLTTVPSDIRHLHNIVTLNLTNNPILNHGESETSWGREKLRQQFGDRVFFTEFSMKPMPRDTNIMQVYAALDAKSPRINRDTLRDNRIPDIPGDAIEDGAAFMEAFYVLLSNLNFVHEDQPGYLSYELLAGDYASDGLNNPGSNNDKIATYIFPRLTGYFKKLYDLPRNPDEEKGWQMYDENKPALKKVLSFIIRSLNEIKDSDQRATLFLLFVDGMLHCPTGQKEGLDTVALSLLGNKVISTDLRSLLSTHIGLKKNLHFKTAILSRGATSGQNVHLISNYEGILRSILGLSNILGYREQMGIFGQDPFSGNASNVIQVYYELLPIQRLVDWVMEQVQTKEDYELFEKLRALREKSQRGGLTMAISLKEKIKDAKQSLAEAEKERDRQRAEMKDMPESEQVFKQDEYSFTIEDIIEEKKGQIARLEQNMSKIKFMKKELEKQDLDAARREFLENQITILERSANRGNQKATETLSPAEREAVSKEIQALEAQVRAVKRFHPISTQVVIDYLRNRGDQENVKKDNITSAWWEGYLSADPEQNVDATLTPEGALHLLIDLGYVIR